MDNYAEQTWNALQEDLISARTRLDSVEPGLIRDSEMESMKAALAESMEQVRAMLAFEDKNWQKLWGGGNLEDGGFDLDSLKDMSQTIREHIYGGGLIKRAAGLRHSFIWSKGISIPGTEAPKGRGARSKLVQVFTRRVNQDNLFSFAAQEEMEKCAASDGIFLLLGDNAARTVRRVPLSEIDKVLVNPDFSDEVWAYLRSWTSYTLNGQPEERRKWYYTDRFEGAKSSAILVDGKPVEVDQTKTIFDISFNRQVGYALGAPDLLAAVSWSQMYTEAMKRGKTVVDSLSQIIYKAVSQTKNGASNAAVRVANSRGAGNTYSTTLGNDLTPMSTAGRGYDFGSLRPIASVVALSADVDVVNLLADPGAAGSSYGAASVLTPSNRKAMIVRQNLWVDYYKRVLFWMTDTVVDVSFDDIDDPDPYRGAQQLTLAGTSGLVWDDELRPAWLRNLNIPDRHDGKLPPAPVVDTPTGSQAASPDQGQSNGAGKNTSRSDLRTDTVSEVMSDMKMDRLQSLVERLEAATNS